MSNRVITKPRLLSSANSSSAAASRFQDVDVAAPTLSGQATKEEVRERQMLQYYEDKLKFQQKAKEKADKKRIEKHERYNHITTGERLGVCEQRGSSYSELRASTSSASCESQAGDPTNHRKQKEEEFREQMRARRELMQEQYNQTAGSGM